VSEVQLPWSLRQNPRLGQWVDFTEPGLARVFTAKVELGQGILTALAQIAAEELRLPIERIAVISGDTRYSPDESYTAGSMSIEIGGSSLRIACAEAREAMLQQAARVLGTTAARLSIAAGSVLLDGQSSELDYWKLAPQINWDAPVAGTAVLTDPSTASYLGRSVPRLDLPPKVAGGAFVHDLDFHGILHARVLRPSALDAHLTHLDTAAAERVPGVIKIWRSGDFVGVCCEREYQAVKALELLRANAKWSHDTQFASTGSWNDWLLAQNAIDSQTEAGEPPASQASLTRCSAMYSKPPVAHASIGPSCAVARFSEGELTVWTHSQGVFQLRAALARALNLDPQKVVVIHAQGAGCYGHNGVAGNAGPIAASPRAMDARGRIRVGAAGVADGDQDPRCGCSGWKDLGLVDRNLERTSRTPPEPVRH
jgi:nicotinate dehydrogenase subunit B